MKCTIGVDMKESWWDVVLMAVVDAMDDLVIDSPEAFDIWCNLMYARRRIQKTLDKELKI